MKTTYFLFSILISTTLAHTVSQVPEPMGLSSLMKIETQLGLITRMVYHNPLVQFKLKTSSEIIIFGCYGSPNQYFGKVRQRVQKEYKQIEKTQEELKTELDKLTAAFLEATDPDLPPYRKVIIPKESGPFPLSELKDHFLPRNHFFWYQIEKLRNEIKKTDN